MNNLELWLTERDARAGDKLGTDRGVWMISHHTKAYYRVEGQSPPLIGDAAYTDKDFERIGTPIALYRPDWWRGIHNEKDCRHVNPWMKFTELKPKEKEFDMWRTITIKTNRGEDLTELVIDGMKFKRCSE